VRRHRRGFRPLEERKTSWGTVGTGLPPAQVLGIRLHQPSSTLVASTFGRSMWELDLAGACSLNCS
jgi:hypothetical protein